MSLNLGDFRGFLRCCCSLSSACVFLGAGEAVKACESTRYIASVGDEAPKNIRAIATEHLNSNPLNLLLDVALFFAERLAELSIERFAFEKELCDSSLGWREYVCSAEHIELSF